MLFYTPSFCSVLNVRNRAILTVQLSFSLFGFVIFEYFGSWIRGFVDLFGDI